MVPMMQAHRSSLIWCTHCLNGACWTSVSLSLMIGGGMISIVVAATAVDVDAVALVADAGVDE